MFQNNNNNHRSAVVGGKSAPKKVFVVSQQGKKKKKGKGVSSSKADKTPTSATSYNGPISLGSPMAIVNRLDTMLLHYNDVITVGTGGIITGLFNSNPQFDNMWSRVASSSSSAVGLYKEFRVLGFRVNYYARNYMIQPSNIPMYTCIDTESTTTLPTDETDVISNPTLKVFHTSLDWHREWKMSTPTEAQFLDTDSPSAQIFGAIKYACKSGVLTSGTVIGEYVITHLVQFRDFQDQP